MKWEPVSEWDRAVISRQLQRPPRNLSGVARRCPANCPQVVVNHPLGGQEEDCHFFPTTFWLTCPAMVERISRLEDHGFIQRIQSQLQQSGDFYHDLRDAHLEYIYLRNSLVAPEVRIELRRTQWETARDLDLLGIGGVRDLNAIKCLHMHFAHYLATDHNPVGQLVKRMLQLDNQDGTCRQCNQGVRDAGVAK